MQPAQIVLAALMSGQDVEHQGTLIRLDGNQLYWRSNTTQRWSPYKMTVEELIRISNDMNLSELRFLTNRLEPSKSYPAIKKQGFWGSLRLRRKKV